MTNSLLEKPKVEKNQSSGSWLQQLLLIDTRTPPKAPPTNLATRPQLALVPVADHEQPFVMFWYPVHPQHPIDYWLYWEPNEVVPIWSLHCILRRKRNKSRLLWSSRSTHSFLGDYCSVCGIFLLPPCIGCKNIALQDGETLLVKVLLWAMQS